MTAGRYTMHPSGDDPLFALKMKMQSFGSKKAHRRLASFDSKSAEIHTRSLSKELSKTASNDLQKRTFSQPISFVTEPSSSVECTPPIVIATLRAVGLPVRESSGQFPGFVTKEPSDQVEGEENVFIDPPFDLSGEIPPADLSGVNYLCTFEEENEQPVEKEKTLADEMVDLLYNGSPKQKLNAAGELRKLLTGSPNERSSVINARGVACLVESLRLTDPETLELIVTGILNLSCDINLHDEIVNLGAVESLVDILESGTTQAQESAAAALYNLSARNSVKAYIGEAGAIPPLIHMLEKGRRQARKDAALALFSLSLDPPNAWEIVRAGAIPILLDLLDNQEYNLEDETVAALYNLAKTSEGCSALIAEECIPLLAEILDVGSPRGQEDAAAVLLLLCKSNKECVNMVLCQGVIPSLVVLSRCGRPRARAKAMELLEFCREL